MSATWDTSSVKTQPGYDTAHPIPIGWDPGIWILVTPKVGPSTVPATIPARTREMTIDDRNRYRRTNPRNDEKTATGLPWIDGEAEGVV
jgi:hypothetical protein